MVVGGGFEPPKLSRQIYSLIPLATREPHRKYLPALVLLEAANSDNRCLKLQDILTNSLAYFLIS